MILVPRDTPLVAAAPRLIAVALACIAASCGGGSATAGASDARVVDRGAPKAAAEQTEVARLFPLEHGHVYRYRIAADGGDARTQVVRVVRSAPGRAELRPMSARPRAFEVVPEGVKIQGLSGGWVLKAPLEVGATWPGEHGGRTTVKTLALDVAVPAGRYSGCVVTVEARGGDRPMELESTYCPDVGLVRLEAKAGVERELAELESYGPPVDLGPDGVRTFKGGGATPGTPP